MNPEPPTHNSQGALRCGHRAGVLGGIFVLGAAWLGPLPTLASHSFAAHMTMHLAVVAMGAPLIALGLAGSRFDPVRVAPQLFAPIPASFGEFAAVWAWHAPALHHAARQDVGALLAEQGTFLLAGLWLWLAAFGGERHARQGRAATSVVALLLTSMHMTLLGALIGLAPRPLYGAHKISIDIGAGTWSALFDQHLGGAIMLLVGGAVYLAGALSLTGGLVRPFAPEPRQGT